MTPAPGARPLAGGRSSRLLAGRLSGAAWLLGLALALVGCQPRPEANELHVFAAASLRQVLPPLDQAFEQSHPGLSVVLNLAGTAALRAQVEAGARVDAFLSADTRHPAALHAAGLLQAPREWVANELALAVAPQSPLQTLAEAARPGVKLVACAAAVPAGAYTEQALQALAASRPAEAKTLRANLVSREADVQAAVARLRLGEADAGFVYRTDLLAAGLREAPLPAPMRISAQYAMAVGAHSPVAALAAAYLDYLAGPQAAAALRRAGFRVASP